MKRTVKHWLVCIAGAGCLAAPMASSANVTGTLLAWWDLPEGAQALYSSASAAGQVLTYSSKNSSNVLVDAKGILATLPTVSHGAFFSDNGAVMVGTLDDPSVPYVYQQGKLTTIPAIPNQFRAFGGAVSGDGSKVVGSRMAYPGGNDAFLYANGQLSGIPQLEIARDVNNAGQVLGLTPSGDVAIVHNGALTTVLNQHEDTNFISHTGNGVDINNAGQAVGTITHQTLSHKTSWHTAFLFSGGAITQFGLQGFDESSAESINDRGQVFGWAWDYVNPYEGLPEAVRVPFLYSGGVAHDLSDALRGLGQLQHVKLDESGNLYGLSHRDGVAHFFRVSLSPVPEPSSWVLAVVGLAGVGVAVRRQRRVPACERRI